MRRLLFCFFLSMQTAVATPSVADEVFPREFLGTWTRVDGSETGAMLVHVHEYHPDAVIGTLEIRGSKNSCPQPIPFVGKVEKDKILIESKGQPVCGFNGTLTAEVVRDGDNAYRGSFRYSYVLLKHNFIPAEGTFRLTGIEEKKQFYRCDNHIGFFLPTYSV